MEVIQENFKHQPTTIKKHGTSSGRKPFRLATDPEILEVGPKEAIRNIRQHQIDRWFRLRLLIALRQGFMRGQQKRLLEEFAAGEAATAANGQFN